MPERPECSVLLGINAKRNRGDPFGPIDWVLVPKTVLGHQFAVTSARSSPVINSAGAWPGVYILKVRTFQREDASVRTIHPGV